MRQGTLLRRDRAQITVVTPSEEEECETYVLYQKPEETIVTPSGIKITLYETDQYAETLVLIIDGVKSNHKARKTFTLPSGEIVTIGEVGDGFVAIKVCPEEEVPGHKHLIVNVDDTGYKSSGKFSRDNANNAVFIEILCPLGQVAVDAGFNLVLKDNIIKTDRLPALTDLLHDWVNTKNSGAAISFFDPDSVIDIEQSIAYVYCAKTEEALDLPTAHFPTY